MNIQRLKEDKSYRAKVFSICSFLATFFFAIYNGVIGFIYHLPWNQSIFFYYLIFLLFKSLFLVFEKRGKKDSIQFKKRVNRISLVLLLLLLISLLVPITLLSMSQKEVKIGMILSITNATYTTYKTSVAIYHFVKKKKDDNICERKRTLFSLLDAVVSILVLQNTLIQVNETGYDEKIHILVYISSFVFFFFMLFLTLYSYIRDRKQFKKDENNIYKK